MPAKTKNKKNITVVGTGYVGLSLAVLLAQNHCVTSLDIVKDRIDKVNKRELIFEDREIEQFFREEKLDLTGTLDDKVAYENAEFIVIATPTNYDEDTKKFDTKSIESVIGKIIKCNPKALIIIKSTIPIGYTETIKRKFKHDNIVFSPEFLRESKSLYDCLYPSRIIMGADMKNEEQVKQCKVFGELLKDNSKNQDVEILVMRNTEAESVKLFANNYLAMRVAFVNEVDMFAEAHDLDTKDIIKGVCLDPRIGSHYNNPSFGYGGYCFPKDTKQLLANFQSAGVPGPIINAVVESNLARKKFVAKQVIKKTKIMDDEKRVVGVYRLIMKSGSDNFRFSAIQDVIRFIKEVNNVEIIIYEPTYKEDEFQGYKVEHDFDKFKEKANIIIANRLSGNLADVVHKVYTRDLFNSD